MRFQVNNSSYVSLDPVKILELSGSALIVMHRTVSFWTAKVLHGNENLETQKNCDVYYSWRISIIENSKRCHIQLPGMLTFLLSLYI